MNNKYQIPEIGLMITSQGVRGIACFGETPEERETSFKLADALRADLENIQSYLNEKLKVLTEGVQE
jgi:hypothetical protein